MNGDSGPDETESKTLKLALVRRNPWMLAISVLPMVMAVVAYFFANWALLLLVPYLVLLASLLFTYMWIRNPRPREIEGDVFVDEDCVLIGQSLALSRERIKAGFVVPRPDKRPIVRLGIKGIGPAVEIRVDNEDDGREVLRRLSLDATQATASFKLPSRIHANDRTELIPFAFIFVPMFLFVAVTLLTQTIYNGLLLFYVASTFAAIAIPALTSTRLRIGADGIVLRWLGKERFIAYDDILAIESYENKAWYQRRWAGAHLRLRSEETITLPVSSVGEVGGPRVRLVTSRLQQAHADHQRGARASAESRLVRGERAMQTWVRDLRRAGAGAAANHRIAPMPTDRLLELAEDPYADPMTRANAAIALGANTESDGIRTRLRAAAHATAAPRLRIALEKAVDVHDEAALAEALAEVEAEAKNAVRNR